MSKLHHNSYNNLNIYKHGKVMIIIEHICTVAELDELSKLPK